MPLGNGLHRAWPYDPETELRTENEQRNFSERASQKHSVVGVKGANIFYKLTSPFIIIRGFAIDLMHCIPLGVSKYFLSDLLSDESKSEPLNIGNMLENLANVSQKSNHLT